VHAELKIMLIKSNGKLNGKWMLKAEYSDTFPEAEMELFSFLKNTCWLV